MTTQRVLITAGASGIGRAMAEAFADAGAQVWVADVDEGALGDCPVGWMTSRLDVADEAGVADLYAQIASEWGGLDVLCANAGIAGPTALIEDVSLADWQRCLSVNLDGAFLTAKHAAAMMKAMMIPRHLARNQPRPSSPEAAVVVPRRLVSSVHSRAK